MALKKTKRATGKIASEESGLADVEVLSSKVVFRGKVFSVRRDVVSEPSGVKATRDVIAHSGSVVVMPVLEDGKIVLIRQYRYAARQDLWELVAGRIDPGENVKEAAARELIEETGLRANKLLLFMDFWPSPGFLEERMYVLLAEGITEGIAEPEADEKIETKAFTREELETMIRKGVLRDAKTISSLLFYFSFMV
jgi:ADP-ribose pyrophosphatase